MFNPQNLNRYSYVLNNPLRYTDPTGHVTCGDGEAHDCNGNKQDPDEDPYASKPTQPPKLTKDQDKSNDDDNEGNGSDQDCSWSGIFGGEGCDPQYYSLGLGLDAPTLMMLSGLGISSFAPEAGLPLILSGAVIEACAYTATPLCAAIKLASANLALTLDKDGNLYLGSQLSWGKSILPFGAISFNAGMYPTQDGHIPTEVEMEDSLKGFSVSAGTIATGGMSYGPLASENNTAYYLVGFPEIFSVNIQYNWLVHDFSP